MFPQVVQDGDLFNRPGFGAFSDDATNGSGTGIFSAASVANDGLSGWLIYLVIGLSSLAVTVFLLIALVIPSYKNYVRSKKMEKFKSDAMRQNKIHPKVIADMKAK